VPVQRARSAVHVIKEPSCSDQKQCQDVQALAQKVLWHLMEASTVSFVCGPTDEKHHDLLDYFNSYGEVLVHRVLYAYIWTQAPFIILKICVALVTFVCCFRSDMLSWIYMSSSVLHVIWAQGPGEKASRSGRRAGGSGGWVVGRAGPAFIFAYFTWVVDNPFVCVSD
jgi:hypothetical protein